MTHSQEFVALGAKRGCHQISKLRLKVAYGMLALYQRQDVSAALVASCLRVILVASYLQAILVVLMSLKTH